MKTPTELIKSSDIEKMEGKSKSQQRFWDVIKSHSHFTIFPEKEEKNERNEKKVFFEKKNSEILR